MRHGKRNPVKELIEMKSGIFVQFFAGENWLKVVMNRFFQMLKNGLHN